MPRPSYPDTPRLDVAEEHFGIAVPDPFRWLENDARQGAQVGDWIIAQNTLTRQHLAALPARDLFRDRLTALYDHERLTAPHPRGGRHFFTRNSGLDNQPVLVMRDGAAEQVVLAGHDAGKPMRQVIEEVTDLWAFAAHWTGLRP